MSQKYWSQSELMLNQNGFLVEQICLCFLLLMIFKKKEQEMQYRSDQGIGAGTEIRAGTGAGAGILDAIGSTPDTINFLFIFDYNNYYKGVN